MNRNGLRSCILESQLYIRATAIFHGVTRLHSRNEQAPGRGVIVAGRNFPLQLPGQPNGPQVFQRVRKRMARYETVQGDRQAWYEGLFTLP